MRSYMQVNRFSPDDIWLLVELQALFKVSRATIYRAIKACNIKTHGKKRGQRFIYSKELWKFASAPCFKRYLKRKNQTASVSDISDEELNYQRCYAGCNTKYIKKWLHEPQEIFSKKHLPLTAKQTADLVAVGFIPTIKLNGNLYLPNWFYIHITNYSKESKKLC